MDRNEDLHGSGESTRPNPAFGRYFFASWIILLVVLLFSSATPAYATEDDASNLTELSLEDLLNVEVTSVSKRPERQQNAAAAIYVLTSDEIRRSGATSIPEALRNVPGISVARLSSNSWSITSRGFGGAFANKLLVLIDGRSVYTPLFSGVYWESLDVVLEDVERIEVIRGPGGTLWGANAVNGVINIVTKDTSETQGLLISGGAGTEDKGFVSSRWGDTIGDDARYRVYIKHRRQDEGGDPAGVPSGARDEWKNVQGGFRVDWDLSSKDRLTIQGDASHEDLDGVSSLAFLDPPFQRSVFNETDHNTRNLLLRWTRTLSDTSEMQVQAYYDYYRRSSSTLTDRHHTADIEFQHRFEAGTRHSIIWGGAFRYVRDNHDSSEFISLSPASRSDDVMSAFIQDDIALRDTLHLILGTKIEHNSYTGIEVQPNVRIRWSPNDRHTLWGAVSRAVRTPSRAEDDIRIRNTTLAGPTEAILQGTRDFDSEDLLAVELGYRVRATDTLAFDVATFYNHYTNYRSFRPGAPFMQTNPDVLVVPFFAANDATASTYGVEVVADWAPKTWWQIRASYSFIQINLSVPAGDPVSATFEGDTPKHQFFVRNRFNLPHNVELDGTFRYVDTLRTLGVSDYLEFDARLAWHPKENLELALVGQNLLDSGHFEFSPTFVNTQASQVQRGVYGKVTWEFKPGGKRKQVSK